MIRTLEDALELIRIRGVVSEVPTHGPTSLVEAVIGGRPEGSWREHAKGRLIYRLGRQLRASPEVLTVRLVEGKVAFVDRSLWETIYCVAMYSERRRRALTGLSDQARALLGNVEREGSVQLAKTGDWTKAREALEERLLVHSSEAQDEQGEHVAVLRSWRDWASAAMKDACARTPYDQALQRLRDACGGAPAGLGPWLY